MSVEASLVQGWLISPFILLPEILKNLEALSKKNSLVCLVDDLMQTPQLCSAKSEVTLYQPVTSIWRVCSKHNRCRHFQIYCLLQFPCNFGINWKKGCAEILLQQKKLPQPSHLRSACQPSSDQANQSPPFWSRDLILRSLEKSPIYGVSLRTKINLKKRSSLRGRRSKGKGKEGNWSTTSLLPRASLAFLSRLKLRFPKLPFPSLSNACHAG